jgi:hypothetical protein
MPSFLKRAPLLAVVAGTTANCGTIETGHRFRASGLLA